MKTSRWVASDFADLKRQADEAGLALRQARKRCFHSNVQYYYHRQLLTVRPLAIFAPSPERLAHLKLEAVARVKFWDGERQSARAMLDSARLTLDKAVMQYREARSRRAKGHGG